MKTLTTLLALALFCATGYGQTIKSLGFNTNGEVVANTGTNVLTFTNSVTFVDATFNGMVNMNSDLLVNYIEAADGTNDVIMSSTGISFSGIAVANTRTNLGLPLPALTNTSNVTMMRELAGSTNTNAPFSGSVSVVGTNNTNTLVFTNGILLEVQ
jgi:hypothetical protein